MNNTFNNTKPDLQPSRSRRGILSGDRITFDDGKEILADDSGAIKLEHSATLFLNHGGDIRVTPMNAGNGLSNSVLFRNVQGDFHRIIKTIWVSGTTVSDIIIDERSFIKNI